jgi:adenylate kinase family enzyme
MTLQRIVVVGTTGSGKTTLAGRLSDRLEIPHIELDALNWGPNWTMRPADEFRANVDQATSDDSWVVDGNYSRARDMLWTRADSVVWLDYPLPLVFWRLLWRTLRRTLTRETLWHGNQERLWTQFFTRDSLFLWAFQTYSRRRREYPILLKTPEYSHLAAYRFHSPSQTGNWFLGL